MFLEMRFDLGPAEVLFGRIGQVVRRPTPAFVAAPHEPHPRHGKALK